MYLSNEIVTASPDSIHESGNHLFWSDTQDKSLKKSIEEFGQTTPVLVCESENGLELVAGHARLSILHELKQPVLARMVQDADAKEKGLLYLTDNMHRIMEDGMRLKALEYFVPLMDEKELAQDILPRLGIKPKSKDARLLKDWLSMDGTWRVLLSRGNVPLAAVLPLSRMTKADRDAVEPLFTGFSWSRSNAVNTLTWLFEITKMTDQPLQKILHDTGMTALLSQGLSPKDAIARLTAAARQARYPELSRLQAKFTDAAGEITTGTRWRMVQPNNFETGGSELTIQVKDANQLRQAVKDLEDMAVSPAWDKIWNMGGGQ